MPGSYFGGARLPPCQAGAEFRAAEDLAYRCVRAFFLAALNPDTAFFPCPGPKLAECLLRHSLPEQQARLRERVGEILFGLVAFVNAIGARLAARGDEATTVDHLTLDTRHGRK